MPHEKDEVNHPTHYTHSAVEVIAAIEAWRLGFHLGNVVKYIARAGLKGGPGGRILDLRKARWYLDREIERAVRERAALEGSGDAAGVTVAELGWLEHKHALAAELQLAHPVVAASDRAADRRRAPGTGDRRGRK